MVRQLTAIMFTDMVGYTALMQEDEHRAKENRDRQRAVLETSIAGREGRILQVYGDGTLSVFQSAIQAVHCAIEIQEALRGGSHPVPIRIGLHTGDVVHDEHGVFGDGVNVAARVEGLGIPGSVLISEKVFDEVKNHGDIQTVDLGSFNLKNVKRPMAVYAIANGGLSIPGDDDVQGQRAGSGKSVAVLPFVNMSSDPENEFFSDGITEEIINALVRVNGLQVTARTSSFAFKNHNQDIRQIAEKLGVTHLLEGSVRRAGNQVRVTAQLICARNGYHLFSEVYNRTLEDIFAVQDEISATIVHELADHLEPLKTSSGGGVGQGHGTHRHSHDSEAYTEYLKGNFEWARWSPDGARAAIRHYKRSAEMDPQCALPYAGLATAYVFLGATGHMPGGEAFGHAESAALRGLELEEGSAEAHRAMGTVRLFYHWDWDGAYRSFQKALSLAPGSAETHQIYAMYLRTLGDFEEVLDELRTALQLDPLSLPVRHSYGEGLMMAGRFDEARQQLSAIVAEAPDFRAATETLGWIRMHEGDPEGALRLFNQLPTMAGHKFAAASSRGCALARLGREDEARAMLELLRERERDHPGVNLAMDYVLLYANLGDLDEAFLHLDEAIEQRQGAVVFLAQNPFWGELLNNDPRHAEALARVGHPAAVLV